ncbi:MAG: transposase [Saprospiraceae bacterium]|nr:transposase [Saprospiraceae bacterium]
MQTDYFSSLDERWKKIFKARFLHQLRQGVKDQTIKIAPHLNFDKLIMAVGYKKWNVYAKAPFGGPAQIIEYLGRYTHKVAISVNRIIAIDDQYITFKYKDYADRNLVKEMSLTHQEFLRRFEQHILPKRFVKIRHAGILTHRNKNFVSLPFCNKWISRHAFQIQKYQMIYNSSSSPESIH